MKAIPFLIVTAVMLVGCSSVATGAPDTITVQDIYDSFIDVDFVVEGTLKEIAVHHIPMNHFTPSVHADFIIPMARMTFDVSKVLIGNIDETQITIVRMKTNSQEFTFDLEEGDRYVLALYYTDRGVFNTGGTYPLLRNDSRFLIEGDRWYRGGKFGPLGTGRLPDLHRAIDELRKLRSIEHLTGEADVIARGTVREVTDIEVENQYGGVVPVPKITMDVNRIMKGSVDHEGYMSFVGCHLLSGKCAPTVQSGEEWIIFLKWFKEVGYYPFAGRNGMFKINGDNIIRDNRIVLPQNSSELLKKIEISTSGECDRNE